MDLSTGGTEMKLNHYGNCPECGSSWDGGSILETFIRQREEGFYWDGMTDKEIEAKMRESYGPPYRWSRLVGVELAYDDPDHYDGISYWRCPDCEAEWDRFTGKKVTELSTHGIRQIETRG